jgi:hypothetical protein
MGFQGTLSREILGKRYGVELATGIYLLFIIIGFLVAVPLASLLVKALAPCAGACDTEDFAPIPPQGEYVFPYPIMIDGKRVWYLFFKYYYLPDSLKKTELSLRFDFLRTVSCTDGNDKDIYDYFNWSTNLPGDLIADIEEKWLLCPWCNEEAELGTLDPHLIEPGKWYYIRVYFTIKKTGYLGFRVEPEVEPDSGATPTKTQEWCLLDCKDYFESG